jgi:hypothetical protein
MGTGSAQPALVDRCGAARSYQYVDQTEIPPGPGLLTGEQGAFVLSVPLPGSQSK